MANERPEDEQEEEGLAGDLSKRWDPDRLSKFISERAGKGHRLDLTTQARYERRLGVDLSNVRVFTGPLAEEVTKAHSAEALTLGSTGMILMRGSSQFTPHSRAGEAVLAHELTHVAQAKPSYQARGEGVSNAPLATEQSEREAQAVEHEHAHGGGSPAQEDPSAKAKKERDKRARLTDMVWELIQQSRALALLRSGRGT